MKYVPSPYQEYATRFIEEHPSAGCFLEMGLGKTVITLTALSDLLDAGEVKRALVIAPLNVARTVWAEEAAKWDHTQHLRVVKVLGSAEERRKALERDADIYVINRENTQWVVNHFATGRRWPFDTLVVDELSSFKDQTSHRFRELRKTLPVTRRVIGLTGTPASNGYIDLWSQIYLLDRGARLGSTITQYRNTYFYPAASNGHVVFKYALKRGSQEEIDRKLKDLCVSMRASDWLKMPERIFRSIPVELEDMKAYRAMERDLVMQLDGETITAASAAVVCTKLLQLTGGAVYDEQKQVHYTSGEKIKALQDIVDTATSPVLVFYAYRHEAERLLKAIKGSVKLEDEHQIVLWNEGRIPVLLAHPDSAGHGLNLQAGGHNVVWYSLTWSLEKYQQANARLWRRGQEHAVIIHHLAARGTIDETILQVLQGKDDTQNALLDAVKARREVVLNDA